MSIESIRDIAGIYVGHATDAVAGTGCTVIVCPQGATPGVDVRGAAPATRETDFIRPEETVQVAHAVVLSGGSAFGLAAASGVMDELERRGYGLDVGVAHVPLVTGACLFDLACGDANTRPAASDGAAAVVDAIDNAGDPLPRGNVGAGTGCTVGKLCGMEHAMKSGLGWAVENSGELVCGAIAAVNACGDVFDPATGECIAGMVNDDGTLGGTADAVLAQESLDPLAPRTNTTISCIVTNARLTKAQATKVAQMSADAYAHTIWPVHTTNDGDTVFVLATGEVAASVDAVGILATRALEAAIVDGATSAEPAFGFSAAK